MKKLFFMAFAVLMSAGASAQLISSNTVTHKESANYNRLNLSYNSLGLDKKLFDNDEKDLATMNGLSISWTKGISISSSSPLFIETGLGLTYAWKSVEEKEDGYEDKITNTFLGLTVPVNLVYKWNVPNTDINIAPFVGLYLRGNIVGNSNYEWSNLYDSGDEDTNWFNDYDDDDDPGWGASRFSIGWNIGVGLEYSKLYVGLSYGSDLNNFIDIDKGPSSKIGTFAATVGFKF